MKAENVPPRVGEGKKVFFGGGGGGEIFYGLGGKCLPFSILIICISVYQHVFQHTKKKKEER